MCERGGGEGYLPDDGVIHFGCNAVFFFWRGWLMTYASQTSKVDYF
jgi:hypothetical protein